MKLVREEGDTCLRRSLHRKERNHGPQANAVDRADKILICNGSVM